MACTRMTRTNLFFFSSSPCEELMDSCSRMTSTNRVAWMTMGIEEFSKFDGHIGCREYTLSRGNASPTPKGWVRESTKIGPALEVVTNYHQGKPGIEIIIESLSRNNSQSWVRISNGLHKYS